MASFASNTELYIPETLSIDEAAEAAAWGSRSRAFVLPT